MRVVITPRIRHTARPTTTYITTRATHHTLRKAVWRSIRSAALQLFEERGYGNVTIEQISAAANVSRATFFNYFASDRRVGGPAGQPAHQPVQPTTPVQLGKRGVTVARFRRAGLPRQRHGPQHPRRHGHINPLKVRQLDWRATVASREPERVPAEESRTCQMSGPAGRRDRPTRRPGRDGQRDAFATSAPSGEANS